MITGSESSSSEWRIHWPLVLAAAIGFSFTAIPVYSMTFFVDPISEEFGWSRTLTLLGLTVHSMIMIPLAPFAGAVLDRIGPRPMALAGLLLSGLTFCSFGLTTGSPALWIGQWAFSAVSGLLLKMMVWTAAVASVFERGRGLAMAVVLSGVAISQTFVPLITNAVVEEYGWRYGFFVLGAGWGGAAFIVSFLMFRVSGVRPTAGSAHAPAVAADDARAATGLSLAEALRSTVFYRLGAAAFLSALVTTAVITHKVSILVEMDVSRANAALIAASAGLAGITGKVVIGWLSDRTSSHWVGVAAFSLNALAFLLLLDAVRTPPLIVAAFMVLGFGAGAVIQTTVILTARHAGLKNYGKIFGTLSSVTSLGLAFGPLLGGAIYDASHSYQPLIATGVGLGLLAGLLVYRLDRYPKW